MHWYLCILLSLLSILEVPTIAAAQTEFVGQDFFPAEFEFRELAAIDADQSLSETSAILKIEQGGLFSEAGCLRFRIRRYRLLDGGALSVEIAAFRDGNGAYSLLSMLRKAAIADGPPGQQMAAGPGELDFTQGHFWVRVRAADPQLARKVAISVSNRIGVRDSSLPPLVKRMPSIGCEPSSLRYMLGPQSFQAFGKPGRGFSFQPTRDIEVAQAHYQDAGQAGDLTLLGFATGQLAEEYFEGLKGRDSLGPAPGIQTYARRVGPLVGLLEGTFEPKLADKILGSLEFQYSIRWIFDKNNRSSATVWGVPVSLLGTVVRSLAFTALLCLTSLFAGFGIAVFRILLRGYAPNNFLDRPERTEMIRLKLDEN